MTMKGQFLKINRKAYILFSNMSLIEFFSFMLIINQSKKSSNETDLQKLGFPRSILYASLSLVVKFTA